MKPRLVHLLALILLLSATACTTPLESRLERHQDYVRSLPPEDQVLLHQGRIRAGMSKTDVHIALGTPTSITERKENGRTTERWIYLGSRPVHRTAYAHRPPYYYHPYYYRHYPGYGYSGPVTYTEYIPTLRAVVEFENELVKSYEAAVR